MEDKTKFALGATAAAALVGAGAWFGTVLGRRLSAFKFGPMEVGHVWYVRRNGKRSVILDEPAIWHLKESVPVQGVVYPVEGKPDGKLYWLLDDKKTVSVIGLRPVTPVPAGATGQAYVASITGWNAAEVEHRFIYTINGLELHDRIVDLSPGRDIVPSQRSEDPASEVSPGQRRREGG